MKKIICILTLCLLPTVTFAKDCPQFDGDYKVQIREALVKLHISQDQCSSYTLTYKYPNQSQVIRTYIPDEKKRLVFGNGSREIFESAKIHVLNIGDKYNTLALEVTKNENYLIENIKTKTVTNFYGEESSVANTLVERRDIYDESEEVISRVYLGYVKE